MGKYCSNCGTELKENADVCLSCGQLTNINLFKTTNEGKGLATISVVFGSLGFYPLLIVGSIVGLITSIIGISNPKNQYKGRSKLGLGLSIGSLSFWIFWIVLAVIIELSSF